MDKEPESACLAITSARKGRYKLSPMYAYPIPTRAQWQTLRDSNHVPKGAAKVSIGDALDKAEKSFSLDTLQANAKATDDLIKALTSYMATVKTKYPAFEKIVDMKVKKKAESHKRFLDDMVKAKVEYYPRYTAVSQAFNNAKNGSGTVKQLKDAFERLKGAIDALALMDASLATKRQMIQNVTGVLDTVNTLNALHQQSVEKALAAVKP